MFSFSLVAPEMELLAAALLVLAAKNNKGLCCIVALDFFLSYYNQALSDAAPLFVWAAVISTFSMFLCWHFKSHFEIAALFFIQLLYNSFTALSYYGLTPVWLWFQYGLFMGPVVIAQLIYMLVIGNDSMLSKFSASNPVVLCGMRSILFNRSLA